MRQVILSLALREHPETVHNNKNKKKLSFCVAVSDGSILLNFSLGF